MIRQKKLYAGEAPVGSGKERVIMEKKLFTRDFTLVVAGQIISLFGNAAIRFALPLYLLNQTGSSALYGTVMAGAFVPMILFSPIGGLIADRVNKRNIMVALDFTTAGLLLVFMVLQGRINLVFLLAHTDAFVWHSGGLSACRAGEYSGIGSAGEFHAR